MSHTPSKRKTDAEYFADRFAEGDLSEHHGIPYGGTQSHTPHTPGPWKYIPEIDGRSRGWIRAGQIMYKGALHPPAVARICTRHTHEEAEANARLIAAAPELVEACEAIVDTDRKRVGITVNPHELYMRAVSLARAALARAKGE